MLKLSLNFYVIQSQNDLWTYLSTLSGSWGIQSCSQDQRACRNGLLWKKESEGQNIIPLAFCEDNRRKQGNRPLPFLLPTFLNPQMRVADTLHICFFSSTPLRCCPNVATGSSPCIGISPSEPLSYTYLKKTSFWIPTEFWETGNRICRAVHNHVQQRPLWPARIPEQGEGQWFLCSPNASSTGHTCAIKLIAEWSGAGILVSLVLFPRHDMF